MSDDIQIITGGKVIEVTKRDGKTERVSVRELPIRALPQLLELQDDEPALVELYCDQAEGWADALTTASHEAILEAGAALNFPVLERWIDRKVAAVERLKPQIAKVQAMADS